ncbi:hypothetical protein [Flavobacterium suncheonense]|uniref:GLPGLI family protein n=1 Tax=Flavobacterium suncheonense GH29-5 = DSM 17707 TaxID=1121899 RepID=A0A0A2M8T5_9FLAO|nr:hypothetical protein [Flavobacterium suncheonense]KGO87873.1 hypothetical protein Q764_12005 [Flavobacterium suncheonense GH29-5 = DSM 17707]
MKRMLIGLLMLLSVSAFAQKKKVAVVTFYANKMVEFNDLGAGYDFLLQDILKLRDDPNFNLAPMLQNYHDNFFNDYSKAFPFELLPETEILNSEAYQNFTPKYDVKNYDAANYLVYDGYKYIYEGFMGKDNEVAMAKMFADKADGVMFVTINFAFEKGFGIGGTATVKMRASTRIALYDKNGEKVLAFTENERSKKTGVMVGGVPVVKPEKILPMCESALTELMGDLKKRIAKIVLKSDKKL